MKMVIQTEIYFCFRMYILPPFSGWSW